jgi:nucleotide-binding universal stress UspA family protein
VTGEQCVIVGVDSSLESQAALAWTLRLADALGWRVVAVHAVGLLEAGGYQPPIDVLELVEQASRRTGVEAKASVEEIAEAGHPAETLVRVAQREEAALIVVGSRGLGRAPRLLGSTSEGVLAHAVTPVLVVPADSKASMTNL